MGVEMLDIKAAHIAELRRLPPIHRDPFDRIIFAQARCEGLKLISVDPIFKEYSAHSA